MSRTLFPEWRDEQEASKYPFSDEATLTAVDGLAFEPDTFLDASLYPIGATDRVFLSFVEVENRSVTLTIGAPKTPTLATCEFDPLDPPELLLFNDQYGRAAGVLVSEPLRLAIFQTWPEGVHRFQAGTTEFVASCVIPMPQVGLRGILLEDGSLLTGDVWLLGEDGVVVRDDGDGMIRVDVVGDPLFRRRLCQPVALFTTPRFIRTINGMPPDENGDFKLTVGSDTSDTILRVYRENDTIKIEAVGQKLRGVQ